MATPKFPIAEIPVPGTGHIAICPLPGTGQGYHSDLQTILGWSPALVISATESHEMRDEGARALSQDLARAGIGWLHLPIRDFGGLEGENLARWPEIAKTCRELLDRDQKILIHCRGGKGRSGMLALRLLVERGADPQASLSTIRSVRPGAVETDEQYRWAEMRTE